MNDETDHHLANSIYNILVCFTMVINMVLFFVIWSKKLHHQPLFIFMVSFAVCDIDNGICMIVSTIMHEMSWTDIYACTILNLFESLAMNCKPILLTAVFVVLSTQKNISRRSAFIMIAVASAISVICIAPEVIETKLITDTEHHSYCYSELSLHPMMLFVFFITKVGIPGFLLIGYFIVTLTNNRWRAIIQKSNVQKMMTIMLIIYTICWTPFAIVHVFDEYVNELVNERHVIILNTCNMFALITMAYKPFLLYAMNDEFKSTVNQILRC